LGCHPDYGNPGIEASTGSLGHGLALAVGICHANKIKNNKSKVFVILSDGELQEGSNWEALMVAPQLGIKNLIIAIDYNNQQSFGSVNETMNIEPIEDKLKSFGWNTYRGDGHNISNMISVYGKLLNLGKPFVFVADTLKGKGVSFMENKTKWHYSPPNKKEFEDALDEINENYK
jgi:transketolase